MTIQGREEGREEGVVVQGREGVRAGPLIDRGTHFGQQR